MFNLKREIRKFRKKIPAEHNQAELLEELDNEEVDFLVSISNRTDGKTFNYFDFLFDLGEKTDLKTLVIVRHYTIRNLMVSSLMKIFEVKSNRSIQDFDYRRTDFYIEIFVKEKCVMIVTDLNAATDIKNGSGFLSMFPIIVYDEFLALETDYLPDEDKRLKMIYESVDRQFPVPYIKTPKILLLGNAVNFDSPILAYLDMFSMLEKQKLNTMQRYDNIVLEMRVNNKKNELRNTRAFKSDNDAMSTGKFEFNTHCLASDREKESARQTGTFFIIKIERGYLRVDYNKDTLLTVIKYIHYADEYLFCTNLRDHKKGVYYLKDTHKSEDHWKKYEMGLFRFDNSYTRTLVTTDQDLMSIKIGKLRGINNIVKKVDQGNNIAQLKDIVIKDNEQRRVLSSIAQRFEGGGYQW